MLIIIFCLLRCLEPGLSADPCAIIFRGDSYITINSKPLFYRFRSVLQAQEELEVSSIEASLYQCCDGKHQNQSYAMR